MLVWALDGNCATFGSVLPQELIVAASALISVPLPQANQRYSPSSGYPLLGW